ncbi:MAG: HutD family protein [Bacillota bacterium]
MAQVLSRANYTVMPWKNGRGTTSQIAIDSTQSQFPDNFLWRVSSASVVSNDHFSIFDGYQRALLVVEGNGLWLNDVELKPFVPYFFSGSEAVDCNLISGPVVDLGIIFKAHEVQVRVEILRANTIELAGNVGIQFLYLAQGQAVFAGGVLNKGDTLKIETSDNIQLTGNSLIGVLSSISITSTEPVEESPLRDDKIF